MGAGAEVKASNGAIRSFCLEDHSDEDREEPGRRRKTRADTLAGDGDA
jgi:hypothetical protein